MGNGKFISRDLSVNTRNVYSINYATQNHCADLHFSTEESSVRRGVRGKRGICVCSQRLPVLAIHKRSFHKKLRSGRTFYKFMRIHPTCL